MSYKIERILNNNAVVSLDEQHREMVITGPGIAFQKKYGGYVSNEKVDKIYCLKDESDNHRLIELISKIPDGYLEITEKVIVFCKEHYQYDLNENIMIALTDHMVNAIERYQKGILFDNKLLWETKQIYPNEFEAGKFVVHELHTLTGIVLPDDEAAFIAFHIVNAQKDYMNTNVNEMSKLTKDILHIIKFHYKKDIDYESLDYHRLISHIKFFVNRILHHDDIKVNENPELYSVLKNSYPNATTCIEKIAQYLIVQNNYAIKDMEKLYLIIHISKLYE